MAIEKRLLLIADIGGYTRFLNSNRINLAHAQEVIAQLLEAVIESAEPFELAKLEGDAAFLHADAGRLGQLEEAIATIRQGFLARQKGLVVDRMCTCDGCMQIENLNLKFVTHAGDVAFQKIKQFTELAGIDVILVHRMLKNDVPLKEYVLTTDAAFTGFSEKLRGAAQFVEHDFEGVGKTRTHYMALTGLPLPEGQAKVQRSAIRKMFQKALLELRTLPFLLGLKTARPR